MIWLAGSAWGAEVGGIGEFLEGVFPPGQLLGLETWQWVYLVGLLIVARLLAGVVRRVLHGQVDRVLHRMGLEMDPAVWQPTKPPLVWLVLIGVVSAGLPELELHSRLADFLVRGAHVAAWVVGTWTAQRFVVASTVTARGWASRTDSKLDDQAIPLVSQAARVLVLVLGGLYAADSAGLDVWKLAAGVGLGGLALALAAQDTVANVFGSVNIFFDKPFQIGDWIKLGEVEGIVEEVGFRSTRVRTFQNSLVTIPNSKITSSNIDNYGVRPQRRTKFVLGLTYETPPEQLVAFVEGVRAILRADAAVMPNVEVHVNDLSDSSIDVLVTYHVVASDWHRELELRQDHILGFLALAARLGVSFAYPTSTVHVARSA